MSNSPFRDHDALESRPFGSSLLISIAVVGVVMAVLVLGGLFIFQGLGSDDDGEQAAVIPSPEGTSELVLLEPSSTNSDEGTPTGESTSTAGNAASPSPSTASVDPTETAGVVPTQTSEDETATEDIAPDPTSTSEPEPEPTDPPSDATATPFPSEGDFGFLPPAQLPSGGVSTVLSLEYQLGMSLEALPTVGTVYQIIWPSYSYEDVEFARDRLGLQADVIEEGVGVYRVDSDRGSLYVSPTEIIYRAAGFIEGSGLPDDGSAIALAEEWVSLSGFIPGAMSAGEVVGRDEDAGRVVVKFRPVEPLPNLAPNPAATVNIGPGNTVLEVRIAWPGDLVFSQYGYSDPLDIWREIQNGQGYLEADITSVFATGQLSGVASITDYSTAYTLAGNPSAGQYLVPVISFLGTARIDQTGDEIPITVSIPVVWAEEGTAG